MSIGWSFPENTVAQLLAFAYLEADTVWLVTAADARWLAQQHTTEGRRSLYCYTDPATPQRAGVPLMIGELDAYRLEDHAPRLCPR